MALAKFFFVKCKFWLKPIGVLYNPRPKGRGNGYFATGYLGMTMDSFKYSFSTQLSFRLIFFLQSLNQLPRPLGRGEEDNRQMALAKFFFVKYKFWLKPNVIY